MTAKRTDLGREIESALDALLRHMDLMPKAADD